MSQMPFDGQRDVLRITRDEAYSEHVEDLLKRQMSLRGEGGIARDRKGRWYYQNWFIFMVAGALGSLAGWALLEPYFDDNFYIQGPIQEISARGRLPETMSREGQLMEAMKVAGWVKVNGNEIWVLSEAKWFDGGKAGEKVDLTECHASETIGLYVPTEPLDEFGLPLATYVVKNPPPDPPRKASLSLQTLQAQNRAAGMVLFAVVAGLVGLVIGAADGTVCRLFRRAVLAGFVGLLAGLIGGFASGLVAGLVYSPLNTLAMQQQGEGAAGLTTFGFLIQMGGRALAWCLAGMAMGLGQGLALRSGRLILYGFLGGIVGGLLGGLLFDPIDLLLLGMDKPSAHWSRLIGLVFIGGCVGAMIGIVELLARDAWLRMTQGPLAGKEFLIFRDLMHIGSSPRSQIYLFNDPDVSADHALIRAVGDNYEIENLCQQQPVCVNERPVQRQRLRDGDQIAIGRTIFVFQKRRG